MTPILVLGENKRVADFVYRGIFGDEEGAFVNPSAIGFESLGNLVAGVVYTDFNRKAKTVELHSYSTGRDWLNRAYLDNIFNYPFEQIGCRIAYCKTSEHNRRVRRIWKALGAKEYILPDMRADGEGECICILSQETWKQSKFRIER
ncbi:MAG: hypothetical protein HRT36_02715 [Alphaproteobacteria bacterium]|nr:hypothetical protein [Alphaproteobacteria bacterium]